MTYYPAGLFIPILGLAINVGAQLLVLRLGRMGLLKSLFLGFAVGGVAAACADVLLFGLARTAPAGPVWGVLANLTAYGALGYCYFHFVNLGETARRIRIMREINDSPIGLTEQEILARYNAAEMVSKRLARLMNNGQIDSRDGRFFIRQSPMLAISEGILFAKHFILGKQTPKP